MSKRIKWTYVSDHPLAKILNEFPRLKKKDIQSLLDLWICLSGEVIPFAPLLGIVETPEAKEEWYYEELRKEANILTSPPINIFTISYNIPVSVNSRKLKTKWTLDVAQDLKTFPDIDIESNPCSEVRQYDYTNYVVDKMVASIDSQSSIKEE